MCNLEKFQRMEDFISPYNFTSKTEILITLNVSIRNLQFEKKVISSTTTQNIMKYWSFLRNLRLCQTFYCWKLQFSAFREAMYPIVTFRCKRFRITVTEMLSLLVTRKSGSRYSSLSLFVTKLNDNIYVILCSSLTALVSRLTYLPTNVVVLQTIGLKAR